MPGTPEKTKSFMVKKKKKRAKQKMSRRAEGSGKLKLRVKTATKKAVFEETRWHKNGRSARFVEI